MSALRVYVCLCGVHNQWTLYIFLPVCSHCELCKHEFKFNPSEFYTVTGCNKNSVTCNYSTESSLVCTYYMLVHVYTQVTVVV